MALMRYRLTVIFKLLEPHSMDKIALLIIGRLLEQGRFRKSFLSVRILLAQIEQLAFLVGLNK